MRRAYTWLHRYRDQVFAGALAVGLFTEVWAASYAEHRVASSAAALLATLPLAVRRRYPIPVFVLVLVGTGTLSSLSPDFDENSGIFFIVFVFILYSLGANTPGRKGWIATALVIPCVIWFLFHDGDSFHPGDIAFAAFVIGGPYAAGSHAAPPPARAAPHRRTVESSSSATRAPERPSPRSGGGSHGSCTTSSRTRSR